MSWRGKVWKKASERTERIGDSEKFLIANDEKVANEMFRNPEDIICSDSQAAGKAIIIVVEIKYKLVWDCTQGLSQVGSQYRIIL